jgi:serine/threonine-protein kinase
VTSAKSDGGEDPALTEIISTDTAELPRAPIVWPWIATLALLGVTAIVVIVAILSDPNISETQTPSPTATVSPSPSASPTAEPTPTETEEVRPVLLLRSDIIGENLSVVSARLAELGMRVNAIPGESVPGNDPRARTVYAVSPTGNIEVGTVIDVTYYVEKVEEVPVVIPEPEPEPTETPVEGEPANPDEPIDSGTTG